MPRRRTRPQPPLPILVHCVLVTRDRRRVLPPAVDARIRFAIDHLARGVGAAILATGCADDHVHFVAVVPGAVSIDRLVRHIKLETNRVLAGKRRSFWSAGYWAEPLRPAALPIVLRYVVDQRRLHATTSRAETWEAPSERSS